MHRACVKMTSRVGKHESSYIKAGVHYTTFVASGVMPTANSRAHYPIRRNISAHITQQKLAVTCANYRVLKKISGFVESKCAYTARRVDVNGFYLFASMAFTTRGETSANNCSDLDQQNGYEIM